VKTPEEKKAARRVEVRMIIAFLVFGVASAWFGLSTERDRYVWIGILLILTFLGGVGDLVKREP